MLIVKILLQVIQYVAMWHGEYCSFKTNTVLYYDSNFINVKQCELSKRLNRKNQKKTNESETRPVELFKLRLTRNFKKSEELHYQKAITDYLREIGKV
jgi:hypothetical protein